MNIIELYESLKGSYKSYLQSFVAIKDERIKDEVSESIKNEKLWRKALIQFNPNFKNGIAISKRVRDASIYASKKYRSSFYS